MSSVSFTIAVPTIISTRLFTAVVSTLITAYAAITSSIAVVTTISAAADASIVSSTIITLVSRAAELKGIRVVERWPEIMVKWLGRIVKRFMITVRWIG